VEKDITCTGPFLQNPVGPIPKIFIFPKIMAGKSPFINIDRPEQKDFKAGFIKTKNHTIYGNTGKKN
jgi:hypothetical protein